MNSQIEWLQMTSSSQYQLHVNAPEKHTHVFFGAQGSWYWNVLLLEGKSFHV